MNKTISVIGLGRLGICFAAILLNKGYEVVGVDLANRIKIIKNHAYEKTEPNLATYLTNNFDNLYLTSDHQEAIKKSDIVFIVVNTPSLRNGKFSTKYVYDVALKLGPALKNEQGFKVVVLVSTVLAGDTERVLVSTLQSISGKRCGQEFGVVYNPELIAQGSIIRDMLYPDLIMIGASDAKSADIIANLYRSLCGKTANILKTAIVNAEISKIAINVFITLKITYTNLLADLCSQVPGANVDHVSDIVGSDSRIGHKYLVGGLPYGGPCFPRDNLSFAAMMRQHGSYTDLSLTTHRINEALCHKMYLLIDDIVKGVKGKIISILGLTYKPETHIVEKSASLIIIQHLIDAGAHVNAHDPLGMVEAKTIFNNKVNFATSIQDCLQNSQLAVVATPWKEYKLLTPQIFVENMKSPRILDFWRILEPAAFSQKTEYYAYGVYKQKSIGK
jgi:UDPglucose 6-dehydrogenase